MELEMATLLSLLAVPAAAGAAYGGVKAGLNGAKQSLAQIERIVNRLDEKVDTHGERLASVETQTANLKERIASVTKSD
jgi:septal ring factor EnvC (AmiA/AmiB activator)